MTPNVSGSIGGGRVFDAGARCCAPLILARWRAAFGTRCGPRSGRSSRFRHHSRTRVQFAMPRTRCSGQPSTHIVCQSKRSTNSTRWRHDSFSDCVAIAGVASGLVRVTRLAILIDALVLIAGREWGQASVFLSRQGSRPRVGTCRGLVGLDRVGCLCSAVKGLAALPF